MPMWTHSTSNANLSYVCTLLRLAFSSLGLTLARTHSCSYTRLIRGSGSGSRPCALAGQTDSSELSPYPIYRDSTCFVGRDKHLPPDARVIMLRFLPFLRSYRTSVYIQLSKWQRYCQSDTLRCEYESTTDYVDLY